MEITPSLLIHHFNSLNQRQKEHVIREITTIEPNIQFADYDSDEDKATAVGNMISRELEVYMKALRNFENAKSAKYSAIFEVMNFLNISEAIDSLDKVTRDMPETVNTVDATVNEIEASVYDSIIKINVLLEGIQAAVGGNIPTPVQTKYAEFIQFHEVGNKLYAEVYLDNVGSVYRNGDTKFFLYRIDGIVRWLESQGLELQPLDLEDVVFDLKQTNPRNIALIGQHMDMSNGGDATLSSSVDNDEKQDIVLPIIGELQALIEDNKAMFDEAPDVKRLLEEFIANSEEQSDLPWITLMWDNDIKSKRIMVKFEFTQQTSERYTLLNFYQHSAGRVGMLATVLDILNETVSLNEVDEAQ